MEQNFMELEVNGAAFSDCRKYRYALWRIWNEDLPKIMFIGLNPSKASEHTNDATIRRVIAHAKKYNYGGVYMCNCYPFISTNPKDLKTGDIKHNAMNQFWINDCAKHCKDVVFAWGSFSVVKESGRDAELASMFPDALALFINADGSPHHPLRLSKSLVPVKYKKQH